MSDDNPFGFEKSGSGPFESPSSTGTVESKKSGGCVKIAVILAALGVVGLICCGGMSYFGVSAGMAAMKAPVDKSIEVMSADAEISQKLGTPIENTSTLAVNQYNNHNNNGDAKVNFNAKGPNGSAQVSGDLTLTAGTWSVDQLNIQFADGSSATIPRGAGGIDVNAGPKIDMTPKINTSPARKSSPESDLDIDLTIPSLKK